MAAEEHVASLAKVIERAGIIFGEGFAAPDEVQQAAFFQEQIEFSDNPPRLIENLRDFLETSADMMSDNLEENDDPKENNQ